MRILVTSRGSSGHVTPLAPFAHAARRAGHQVLLVVQDQNASNAERLGLPFTTVDSAPPEAWMPVLSTFAELDLDTANHRMLVDYFGALDTRAALPALNRLVESWRPDVIVRESWEFASTIAGELHGVPVARVGLSLGSIEEATDALLPPVLDPIRAEAGLPPDPAGRALRDTPYLTMVPEELDDAPRAAQRFGQTPPPPAEHPWPGDEPLVYVSFGSVAAGAHLPYFPALYRQAIDALSALPARILMTVGEDRDHDALGPLPANVRVERWVPQDAVLASAQAVVTHGGYGSTLGALAHGVPSVVLPLFSLDQWANAAAVARSGAGIALDDDRATRRVLAMPDPLVLEALGPAVRVVLEEPYYATNARRISDAMAALPVPDAAVGALPCLAAV
jgi:UDP:flavonoid glycosyltransferase YjiC (YdhE family)